MTVLVAKFHDLVLDRRAIARANALNLTGVQWRSTDVPANRVVENPTRVSDEALYLVLFDLVG